MPHRLFRNRLALLCMVIALTITCVGFYRARTATHAMLIEEQELREVVMAVLDSNDYGLAITDSQGNVIEWNPAMERLTGWTKKELTDGGLGAMIHGDMWLAHCRSFDAAMKRPHDKARTAMVDCAIPSRKKDGPPIPVRITVRIHRAKSGRLYAVAHIDRTNTIKKMSFVPPQPQTIGAN